MRSLPPCPLPCRNLPAVQLARPGGACSTALSHIRPPDSV